MSIFNYIFPSFGVNLVEFESSRSIKLIGNNNWQSLILGHSAIIITIGILIVLFHETMMSSIFTRTVSIIIILIVGGGSYNTFRRVRSIKYLKEEIGINSEGIYLNHLRDSNSAEFINKNQIRKILLIVDGFDYKFFLNGADKIRFEFQLIIDRKEFLQQVLNILKFNVIDESTFDSRVVYRLEPESDEEKVGDTEANLLSDLPRIINSDSKISKPKGRAKYFTVRSKEGLTILQSQTEYLLDIPKKIWISKNDRSIWHKRFFLIKEEIKFSEIETINHEVTENSDHQYGVQIEGNLYLNTIYKKRKKVFTIRKVINKERELVEVEVLDDLKIVEEIIKKIKNTLPNNG